MDSCKDYISTQALGGQDERVQLRVAVDNTRTNLVPLLPPDRNAKIVDEACSYGRYLKALRDLGYTDTLGIDLSAEQVAFARDRLGLTCASLDAPTRLVGILRHVLWRWALNPLLGFLTTCAYGTSAGGIFTANLLAQAKK